MNQTWENTKKPSFGPSGRHFFFFCFKNLAPSVTRYHGQLSPCTEKTYDPILRKLSDGRTDGRTKVISQDAVGLTSSVQNEEI